VDLAIISLFRPL